MPHVGGINHVAIMTHDLDRFVAFYTEVFELEVVFEETTPAFRHAILRAGESSWLHPVAVPDNPHGHALPAYFGRGHLDHLGLTAISPDSFNAVRRRLLERSATTGRVDNMGAFHSLAFCDPDGMHGELTMIVDRSLQGIHAPRPISEPAHE